MPAATFSLELALAASAVALAMLGAAAALILPNAIKRVAGLTLAGFGAVGALAVLGAPEGAVLAGVAVTFAYTAIGAAIAVRLQESYGSLEAGEIDAADAGDDAQDRAA